MIGITWLKSGRTVWVPWTPRIQNTPLWKPAPILRWPSNNECQTGVFIKYVRWTFGLGMIRLILAYLILLLVRSLITMWMRGYWPSTRSCNGPTDCVHWRRHLFAVFPSHCATNKFTDIKRTNPQKSPAQLLSY